MSDSDLNNNDNNDQNNSDHNINEDLNNPTPNDFQNNSTNDHTIDNQNNHREENIDDDTSNIQNENNSNEPAQILYDLHLLNYNINFDDYNLTENNTLSSSNHFLSLFNDKEYQIFLLHIKNYERVGQENGFIQYQFTIENRKNRLNHLLLTHFYKQIPTSYNQKYITEQIYFYMKNPKFSLANFYGFTVGDEYGNFIPTVLTDRPVNGPLSSVFESAKTINSIQKLALICGIIHGISFIHDKGFIHSNLNPETVYLDENMFPVICDYIFVQPFDVKIFKGESDEKKFKFSFDRKLGLSVFKNPLYVAPEIFKRGRFDQSSDIYSLGLVIFYIMVEQEAKLNDKGEIENYPPNFYEFMKELINNCINKIPNKRPRPKNILKSLLNFERIQKFTTLNSEQAIEISKEIEIYLKIIKSDIREEDEYKDYNLYDIFNRIVLSINDHDQSTQMIIKGASNGNAECIEKVGDFFFEGERNFIQDDHFAYICYEKASAKGSIKSMKIYAKMNEDGIGTEPKLKKSYLTYKQLLEKLPEDDPERPQIISKMNEIDDKIKTLILKNIPIEINESEIKQIFNTNKLTIQPIKLNEKEGFQDIKIKFEKTSDLLKISSKIRSKKIKINHKPINNQVFKFSMNDRNRFESIASLLPRFDANDFYPGKLNENYQFFERTEFTRTYIVYKKENNRPYMAKIFDEQWKEDLEYFIKLLIKIQSKFNHPAIIKYVSFNELNIFEKEKNKNYTPTLLMDFMPKGNLENVIHLNPSGWNDTSKLKVIIGITSALAQMHASNYADNNLKTSNILLNKNFEPVICNFGITSEYFYMHNIKMTVRLDQPVYVAPELLIDVAKPDFKYKADIYAFGIILYQILTNSTVNNVYPTSTQFQLVNFKLNNFVPELPDDLHPFFKSLINTCFNVSCNERPDMIIVYNELVHLVKSSINLLPNADMKSANDYLDKLPEIVFFFK